MSNQPNGPVPPIRGNKTGSRGGRTYAALQDVWNRLSTTEHRDAMGFADEAATAYMLNPASVRSYVYALVAEGSLEKGPKTQFTTVVTRGGKQFDATRHRDTFRIVA